MTNVINFPSSKRLYNEKENKNSTLYSKVRVKMTVYPESIRLVSKLINNELRKINRDIEIAKRAFQKNKLVSLTKSRNIFENLISITANAKDMSFVESLTFEELDCFLGVIELRLQEFEILEIQMITGVDMIEK